MSSAGSENRPIPDQDSDMEGASSNSTSYCISLGVVIQGGASAELVFAGCASMPLGMALIPGIALAPCLSSTPICAREGGPPTMLGQVGADLVPARRRSAPTYPSGVGVATSLAMVVAMRHDHRPMSPLSRAQGEGIRERG